MVPVTDEHRARVDIVLCVLGPVHDERSMQTTRVLRRVVRVIPRGAVQIGLEAVGEGCTGRDGTLLDRGHAIKPGGFLLEESIGGQ